jgi:O-antigen/teichoic acid export membrane protein
LASRVRGRTSAFARDRGRAASHLHGSGDRGAGTESSPHASPAPVIEQSTAPSVQRDLESKVRAGTKWSMLNSIVLSVAGILIGAVLARTVFGPPAWGLYAISQAILVVLLSVNELGVSAAIIRWEGDVRSFARTVVTLSLIASTLMYVALYAISPFATRLLGIPGATPMLRVLCICVIIDALCAVPIALLNREFAQGRRMLVDCLNFGVRASVTLWLAYTGHGVISLAWGALAGSVVALIVSNAVAPFFVMPGWDNWQARRLLRFGLPLAGANLFGLAVLNIDSAIVAVTLGPAMLGLYQLAFGISSAPVGVIAMVVQRVSYAGFSRVADAGKGIAQAFNGTLSLLMALTVPACVLLATLARPLIHAVYGERWIPASGALSLLAVLGLMRVAFVLINNCIVAADKRSALMAIQGMWLAALIPALLVGARLDGIVGAAAGHVFVAAAVVAPASLWTLSRAGITVRSIARACARPAVGGALMAAASLSVSRLAGPGVAGLVAAIAAGSGVYLLVVYPMRSLLQRSPERGNHPDAGDPANSGTTTTTIFDLENSCGLCVPRYTTS